MVLEDAHWIDPTTLEMIEQSLDRIAAARVLMLLTSRPDDQPELATHPHLTRLTLNRLGRLGIEAIVARLGGGCLPTQTLDTIIARTDGVPLFVEELTKAILETGETSIPASLHDSLMARFDRLPEAKDVAQIAACIGREFSHALLAEIADRDEPDLIAVLDQLLGSELVFRRGLPPDAMYSFKHALLQDAAYQSLLKSRRRDLHARVVEALEARSENLEAAALGVLANHCARAGLAEKASDYWYRAGQQAIARSAMVEAVEQLGQGLEALAGLRDGSERRRKELDLQIALGGALIGLKGHGAEETGHAFARARALCHEVGDAQRLMPVLGGQLGFDIQRGAPRAAHEIASAMLELAEQHADSSLLIQAHRGMSSAALELGHFAVAREHAERLLAIYDPARHSAVARGYAYDMRTVALGFLAQALFALGYPDHAHRPREIARLPWIDAAEPCTDTLEGVAKRAVVTAGRLEDDPCPLVEAGSGQPAGRFRRIGDTGGSTVRVANVEPVLGDIDTDEKVLHHVPCPVLRGLRQQPRSTVQDDIEDADGSQATTRGYPPEPLRDAVRNARLSEAP